MKTIAFFNNKGGVGKTTFTYHLGYSLETLGKRVLFVDLDPQCNLTAHIFDDNEINQSWGPGGNSIHKAVEPIISGAGDFKTIPPHKVSNRNIWVFMGDLLLTDFDGELSSAWTQILAGQERGFRVTSAIYRLINEFATKNNIDYVLIDLGPNLGSLNRAILLGCDNFIVPMIPDLFSLRGSQNLGRVFADWIKNYELAKARIGSVPFNIQNGKPIFSGYVLQQFNVYRNRKTKAYAHWGSQIPHYVQQYVVNPLVAIDPNLALNLQNFQVAEFKNYHTLLPMAQESLKPIFELTSQDGVVGGHFQYVDDCKAEFRQIGKKIITLI
ncbi:ParA family protein [Emticicia sp. TH156]|uniref:ParA family protein n=1 Tax=Emticicia sp. TH156 TaxID=2067454 RepID=UPI000C76EB03|nr:ParA family protein [Emticicia sp. TH156]PLK43034.1 chromosome partitioning protein [Emticicia sp. TH156]